MTLIKRLASRQRKVDRLAAQLDRARHEARGIHQLRAQLVEARAHAESAQEETHLLNAKLDTAQANVRKLTLRLTAVDVDRLRGENADLRAEVALLRSQRQGPSREEYLRERETNARLAEQLRQAEERLQKAEEALAAYEAAPVSG